MQKALITPSKLQAGAIVAIPGSKSYTNRALVLAALAEGESTLRNPLFSDDTKVAIKALGELGVRIERKGDDLTVYGRGGSFDEPRETLFLGNAGTAVRFFTALLCVTGFKSKITGNKRMQERPLRDLISALHDLGVKLESINKNGCPPIKISGNGIKGGKVELSGKISSQYLSALLMIAPYAESDVEIVISDELVSKPYIDMTLQIMKDFGIQIKNEDYSRFVIKCGQRYKGCDYKIEGDASSASYFYALEKLHGVKLDIQNINPDSLQADMGFLDLLGKGVLPSKLDLNHMPDAAMTVAILAAFTKGKTQLTNIANLRHKETDRIKGLVTELKKVGCDAKELEDGIEINGDPEKLKGPALIETYDDHRMAMCFAVLASKIPDVQILDPDCTSKTYPQFFEDLAKTGIKLEKREIPNIYLTGMRGSGKSAIGKELAKVLNFDFIDSDEEIERQEKSKISQIVKKKSWFYFRKKEKYVIRHLARKSNIVIATGGGVILDKENVSTLKKNGKIVLLTAPIATLEKRIANDTNRPPLTNQKTLKKELEELWAKRKEKYMNSADFEFDSSCDLSLNEKAQQIIQLL